jgi:hypothetical protein
MTPTKEQIALKALDRAIGYIGCSRASTPDQVTRFCNLLGFPFADPDTGEDTSFCDLGVAYATDHGYCDLAGIPYTDADAVEVFKDQLRAVAEIYFPLSASTQQTRESAIARGQWLDAGDCEGPGGVNILPGWWVLFDWNDSGVPDHIGIVEADDGDTIGDVEFNTTDSNGNTGCVARKVRPWAHILGFVRTYS